MEEEKSKKSNKKLINVLIVIIVLLLCVIGYLLFRMDKLNKKCNNNITTTQETSTKEINCKEKVVTDTTDNNINDDVTEEPEKKLSGLWYNKEENFYFHIEDGVIDYGEFSTDAIIDCKIKDIKIIDSNKYRLEANNCSFDDEKRDDRTFEFIYSESDNQLIEDGLKYKYYDEDELYDELYNEQESYVDY